MNSEQRLPEWTAYACRVCHKLPFVTQTLAYEDGGCAGNCGHPRDDSLHGRLNALVEMGRALGIYIMREGEAEAVKVLRTRCDELLESAMVALSTEQPASAAGVEGSEVVGHKTFGDGRGGFRHEPLTRAEADVLIAHCRSEDERRKALMPDEQSAIRMMMDAHTRLTDMGWKDPIYCPKDGRTFEVIEPGSTGIFKCIYMGDWPKGSWWVMDDADMFPSRPVLFRPLPAAPQPATKESR